MPEPWEAEREVDAALARELLEAQFPGLSPVTLSLFGQGWDNTAFLVNGLWVFRFPRQQAAVAYLEAETRLLPALAGRLPLPVPVPERIGRPSGPYPWPFAGYRMLPGRTACRAALDGRQRAALAPALGGFLRALHGSAAPGVAPWGDTVRRMDVPFRLPRTRARLDELEALGCLADVPRARLDPVLEGVPGDAGGLPPAWVHGDLYARHLLVDGDARLSGVIDWGDAHLGDPACELSILFLFLPPAARGAFLQAYGPVAEGTWRRARFRALSHAVEVYRFARGTGDADLLRECRLALEWIAAA